MKLRFYIDFWPDASFQLKNGLVAMTQPNAKMGNYKRVAFDVTVPDEFIFDYDMVAPEVSRMEVVDAAMSKEVLK